MRKIIVLSFAVLCAGLLVGQAKAAIQDAPAAGTTPAPLKVPVDGNGVVARTDAQRGWKVFENNASAAAVLVKDEAGNAPTHGVLHAVCVSTAVAAAVVVDTNTVTGLALISGGVPGGNALLPPVVPASTGNNCVTVDANFENGLVIENQGAAGMSVVYWRPRQ